MNHTQNLNILGNASAKVVVVCDAPGEEIYSRGWVMPQAAMNVLGSAAGRNGFDSGDIAFITCSPPIPESEQASEGKINKFAKDYQQELQETLLQFTHSQVVVPMGKLAASQVAGHSVAITRVQGQIMPKEGVPYLIFPMLSPAHVLRKPEAAEQFEIAFKSLATLRDANWNTQQAFTSSVTEAQYEWCMDLSPLLAAPPRALALDTETVGFYRLGFSGTGRLLTVQITTRKGHAYVIPIDREWWERFTGDAALLTYWEDYKIKNPNLIGDNVRAAQLSFFASFRQQYPEMPPGYREMILGQLRELLANPRVAVAGHNLKYDIHALGAENIVIANYWIDTVQAAFAMDENMPEKSLDEVARRWCQRLSGYADAFNTKWDKSRMDLIPPWELLAYAGGDTDAVFDLANTLVKELVKDQRQWKTFTHVQMPALRAFAKMEKQGKVVSRERLRELASTALAIENTLYESLIQRVPPAVRTKHMGATGDASNLRFSRASFVTDTLFTPEGFNLRPIKFTKATQKSEIKIPSASSKDHLPFFTDFKTPDGYDFVSNLIEYQKLQKLRSTYIGEEAKSSGYWQYISPEGRTHSTGNLHSTVTGRSAFRDPNDQNIPARGLGIMKPLVSSFRKVFKATPGYKIVSCDLSQAELRVSAWVSNDPVMLEVYRSGGDIHATTAAANLGITIAQFNDLPAADKKSYRFYAKAVNFGFIYGMGATKFRDYAKTSYMLDFTEQQASEMRDKFFRTYPALEGWHAASREFVRKHGYVRSLHGAVRHLVNIQSHDRKVQGECERMAINSPIQRFASDIGLMALSRLVRDTPWEIIRPIMFIHDALVCEVREDHYDLAMPWIKFYMETPPLQRWFGLNSPVPIVADVSGGEDFGSLEEYPDIIAEPPPFYNEQADLIGWR